jgi:NADPH2:quinone reductase
MKAITLNQNSQELHWEEIPIPSPTSSEILVKNQAAGINYVDLYTRQQLEGYQPQQSPHILGIEGAGTVVQKGNLVTDKIGVRVAYVYTGSGCYAEYTTVPADRAIPLPESIDCVTAAASLLAGLTAQFLTHSTFPLKPEQTVLIHAAAGGVGLFLAQMAKLRGAKVIGTVSTQEKAKLTQDAGTDYVINYSQDDFETEVMRLTKGKGVDVVYDSVGAATFEKSINVLKNRGMLVLFGQSSGFVSSFNLNRLCNRKSDRGSFYITRPTIRHYIQGEELKERAAILFDDIEKGKLKVLIGQTYQLSEAQKAHDDLSSRLTKGKSILLI